MAGVARVDGSKSPDVVTITRALDHYYENDVKAKPSATQAFQAISLVHSFLKSLRLNAPAPVSSFGPIRQREFMNWCREQHSHSPAYIARLLSVVSAAFRFGKRVVVITDELGNKHEVQLLDMAPDVVTQAARVAELINAPEPTPRDWLPTFEEFGKFIDAIDKRKENLFRFVILALNTWARPQTIIDFRDNAKTVNRRFGTVDLNPPGRRQTIKYRPKIRLTKNLRDWLDLWGEEEGATEAPMMWDGEPIDAIKRTFVRHAVDCHLDDFTPGTIRHFMATMVRREKPPVPKEQRDVWLGHDEKRTANAYESFDPEYLQGCMQATERVIEKLQKCTKRPLFACKLPASRGLKVIQGGKRSA
jgi:integrase